MYSPDIFKLRLIEWQFFGTLTFKSERLPNHIRIAMYFAMMRKVAKTHRLYFPKLLWCLSPELGGTNGRFHFHYLLAGLPQQLVTTSFCASQMAAWEEAGGGMARVYLYNPRLDAVGYVLKTFGRVDEAGHSTEVVGSRASHPEPMFSHAAEKVILRRAIRERVV